MFFIDKKSNFTVQVEEHEDKYGSMWVEVTYGIDDILLNQKYSIEEYVYYIAADLEKGFICLD